MSEIAPEKPAAPGPRQPFAPVPDGRPRMEYDPQTDGPITLVRPTDPDWEPPTSDILGPG